MLFRSRAAPQGQPYCTLQTNKVFYFVYFNDSPLLAASVSRPLNPHPWLSLGLRKEEPKERERASPAPQAK